jgi:hypothetical protein
MAEDQDRRVSEKTSSLRGALRVRHDGSALPMKVWHWACPFGCGLSILLLSGCALTREPSRTPRTAIEQLLLSQSISRSMEHLTVPVAESESVNVEVVGFPSDRSLLQTSFPTAAGNSPLGLHVLRHEASDLPVLHGKLEARLGALGLSLRSRREDAQYFMRVIVESLGTEQGESFIGMPPVQSVLLPFSLPELTIFKAQRQRAYTRYTADLYDVRTGRLLRSTPWYEGGAYYNQYSFLFFFTVHGSDLVGIQ